MKVLMTRIFIIYYVGYVKAGREECPDDPPLRCNFACNPKDCEEEITIDDCPMDGDYYIQPACTDCNRCATCEKYREKGDCCYSDYGTKFQCRGGFPCSYKSKKCEEAIYD